MKPAANKKFKVVALGCRTNQYEGQAFTDQLSKVGYSPAMEGEEADLCIINTCTVTHSADSSSRHQIRSLARQNPNAQVVVTGCLAERAPEQIAAIEGVDLVVPNDQKEDLLSLLFPEEEDLPEFAIEQFSGHTRAFVKVQDGCNSFCTYCIIPYVRGRSRSRPIDDILLEVKRLIDNGYKEIVLTGINIGDFDGGDKKARLVDLVRAVDAIEGVKRLRISSIDPDEVDEELLEAVIQGRSTCPSMHIVLQAGSNVVLKRMNRKYTKEIFLDTVDRLRKANPSFTFTTDIIVGFPGETDKDFEETLDVMREVRFAKVHMFPYSTRKRTRAFLYTNLIAPDVIAKRKQIVLDLANQLSMELREQYIGQMMSVLVESESTPTHFSAHTANFLPVLVPKQGIAVNDLIDVELIANSPDGLIGRPYAH